MMMMAEQKKPSCLLKLMVIMPFMLVCTVSDSNQDKQECASSLVGLATCLPYVGGTAKSPTPDCCSGLKGVLKTDKKCLCLVIKDRNDPDLGLTINVTLALGLPTVCNAPANISACPDLLHLDPNSPDAKVFFQGGHAFAVAPAGSPAAGPSFAPGGAGAGAPGSSGQSKSDSGRVGHGLEVLVLWTFSVYFAS